MHTIIAFDDHVNNGHKRLFQDCSDNARQISVNKNIQHTLISSSELTKDYISSIVDQQGDEDFLFVAFSHGGDDELVCTNVNEPYISSDINTAIFGDKIVYTYACNAGSKLGNALVNNGAKAFVGYTEEVWATYDIFEAVADCATHGINVILDGRSLEECINEMKGKYTSEYTKALENGDLIGAGYLLESREALVLIS